MPQYITLGIEIVEGSGNWVLSGGGGGNGCIMKLHLYRPLSLSRPELKNVFKIMKEGQFEKSGSVPSLTSGVSGCLERDWVKI